MARKGWATSTGADSAVPIFYNASRYKLLAHDVVKEFDVERIENGPSGTSIGPRWIQWVQLQDRTTGAVFFVVNHHIIPGVAAGGRPRTSSPERLAIRDKQVAMANSIITKLRRYGPVALTEDSNVDNRADQRVKDPRLDYVQMQRMRMATNWTMLGVPRSGSLLDKIAVTVENTRFLAQSRLPSWGSDHHAVVATITKTISTGQPSDRDQLQGRADHAAGQPDRPRPDPGLRPDQGRRGRDPGRAVPRRPPTRLGRRDRRRPAGIRAPQPRLRGP